MFKPLNLLRKNAVFAVLLFLLTIWAVSASVAVAAPPPEPPAEGDGGQIGAENKAEDSADPGKSITIIRDCNDDGILQGADDYTAEELNKALDQLASDVDQYSDCRSVLNAALAKTGKNDDGGSGAIPVTPEQRVRFEELLAQERAELAAPGARPIIPIGGKTLSPGQGSTFASSDQPGLPLPLLFVLVMAAVAVLPGAYGGGQLLARRLGWEPRLPLFGGTGVLGLGRKPRLND